MLEQIRTDMILYNGNIYTMGKPSKVNAIAVGGSRVIALGSDKEIFKLSDKKTRFINLGGMTVLPGFTDSHVHFYSYGLSVIRVNLAKCKNLKQALNEIKKKAANLKRDEWLLGRGWDKNYWGLKDFPNKKDLDSVCKNPCAFSGHDGHSLWVNSAALKIAGITGKTPDPRSGVITRDADGNPAGVLLENAVELMTKRIPDVDLEYKLKAIQAAQKAALKVGVTGVHDFEEDDDKYLMLQTALHRGILKIKVHAAIRRVDFDKFNELSLLSGIGNPRLSIGPLKLYSDGALGSQTAYMFKPYENSKSKGVPLLDSRQLYDYIRRAESSGYSCAIHAIGDKANKMVIDAYNRMKKKYKPVLNRRIEHVQIIRPEDLPALKASKAIASLQPSHILADRDTSEKSWGKRSKNAYIFRSMLKHKIPVCFGSDAPIETLDPLIGIYAAVNRHHPDDNRGPWFPQEKLSVQQAVAGFTTGAAFASNTANVTGRLMPGYFADMVVLSDDIFRMSKNKIYNSKVVATICSGSIEFGSKNLQ
ncbi:MAG: amidohydrolase family protein [candidate division Zixibacteria bacterium]|nr:amidohydrolase family protein [candidate division Zixibacteria bacterium]